MYSGLQLLVYSRIYLLPGVNDVIQLPYVDIHTILQYTYKAIYTYNAIYLQYTLNDATDLDVGATW